MGLLALVLVSGCLGDEPVGVAPAAEVKEAGATQTWYHAGRGAVTFTLWWDQNVTIETEFVYPPDTHPYAAGNTLSHFNATDMSYSILGSNGGQGILLDAGSMKNVTLRPFHEPFPNLTQRSQAELLVTNGPRTEGFAILAASGNSGVPFEVWVNGTSFRVLDGPHEGTARALSFEDWGGPLALKARVYRTGGTILKDTRLDWTTTNGTVAFYLRSLAYEESVTYERSRISNANESWNTEFVSLSGDRLALDQSKTIPHVDFFIASHEKEWSYEVSRRASADFPVELLLVGDVRPPGDFAEQKSILLPRVES